MTALKVLLLLLCGFATANTNTNTNTNTSTNTDTKEHSPYTSTETKQNGIGEPLYWRSQKSGIFSQFLKLKLLYKLALSLQRPLIILPISGIRHYKKQDIKLCNIFDLSAVVHHGTMMCRDTVPDRFRCGGNISKIINMDKSFGHCYNGGINFNLDYSHSHCNITNSDYCTTCNTSNSNSNGNVNGNSQHRYAQSLCTSPPIFIDYRFTSDEATIRAVEIDLPLKFKEDDILSNYVQIFKETLLSKAVVVNINQQQYNNPLVARPTDTDTNGLEVINKNTHIELVVVHWRRDDQGLRCKKGLDRSVNCGSVFDFMNKINVTLNEFDRSRIQESKSSGRGIGSGSHSHLHIGKRVIYVATNEKDKTLLKILSKNGFQTFDGTNTAKISNSSSNFNSYTPLTVEVQLMLDADLFLAWGASQIDDVIQYERRMRKKPYCVHTAGESQRYCNMLMLGDKEDNKKHY